MSAKVLEFKKRPTQWEALLSHFEKQPKTKKIGHYKDLLKWLRNKETFWSPNSLLKDWCDVKNQIRQIEKRLKEISNGND